MRAGTAAALLAGMVAGGAIRDAAAHNSYGRALLDKLRADVRAADAQEGIHAEMKRANDLAERRRGGPRP